MGAQQLAVLVTALVVAAPAAASAAPRATAKTVCNLIPDRAGDGGFRAGGDPPLDSPPTDILVADIATGQRTVVATIKVASFDTDPQALLGIRYDFFFTVKNSKYRFTLRRDGQGNETFSFSNGSAQGSKVDTSSKTIRFTTSRRNVKELSKKGQKLTVLLATTYVERVSSADSAISTTAYVDRTPSCLKPT